MKSIFVLCVVLMAFGANGEEMKDKRALLGFGYGYGGYGLAPYGGYPGAAGYVHGYHGYGYRGFGYPYDGYHHPYAYHPPGALAYQGAAFGYGSPFLH